jgi:hypothetical protein
MCARSSNNSASVGAMDGHSVRNAVAVRSSNDRRNNSVLRSSSPRRLRKPRASGRGVVAGVVAAEIAAKNPLRIRT